MHIVIIGATGLVGALAVKQFIENEKVEKITTITRKRLSLESSKLNQILLNPMSIDSITSLELNADIFVCALGTTIKVAGSRDNFRKVDLDLVVAFAQLAEKSSAQALFVVSALGASSRSPIFYNRVKGEMEQSVSAFDIPSIYILQPSLLIGNREEKRFAEATGIALYRVSQKIIPQRLTNKIGTPIELLVTYIENQFDQLKPGKLTITDFDSAQ